MQETRGGIPLSIPSDLFFVEFWCAQSKGGDDGGELIILRDVLALFVLNSITDEELRTPCTFKPFYFSPFDHARQ